MGWGLAVPLREWLNPAGVLVQAVKIEVFLRCVVAEHEHAEQVLKDVLCQLEASITTMEDELKSARLNPEKENGSIAEQEEIVKILKTCSRRCTDWAREKGILSGTDRQC